MTEIQSPYFYKDEKSTESGISRWNLLKELVN